MVSSVIKKDTGTLEAFCQAFPQENAMKIEKLLNEYLWNTISIRDISGREKKENFYHGMILGLLRYKENWLVKSNAESGEGYSDILIEVPESRTELWWKSNMQKMQHLILPAIRQSNRLRKSIMRQHCMGMVWRML